MRNQQNASTGHNTFARQQGKKKTAVYCAAIVVLLTTGLYACKSNTDKQQASTLQPANVQQAEQASDTLQAALGAARSQIDMLMSEKLEADSTAKKEIATLESQLNHYKRLDRRYVIQLKKAKKMMKTFQQDAYKYAVKFGLLQDDNNGLLRTRDSLEQSYTALKELGSVLHASNIRLMAYNLKHRGRKEKATARARKTKLLRVKFDIDENRIAENGTKKLYLVIKGPDGNLITDGSYASGTTRSSDGGSITYSVAKEIALRKNQPAKDVTVDWKQKAEYKKGNYDISIYNGGYEIGDGTVRLN